MNRRGFLTACIATCTAPAIVRASSLMQISPRFAPVDPRRWGDRLAELVDRYVNPPVVLDDFGHVLHVDLAAFGVALSLNGKHVPRENYTYTNREIVIKNGFDLSNGDSLTINRYGSLSRA